MTIHDLTRYKFDIIKNILDVNESKKRTQEEISAIINRQMNIVYILNGEIDRQENQIKIK